MSKAVSSRLFHGLKLPHSDLSLSHLLYADDVILLGKWSDEGIHNIKRIMRIFYLISGLRINFRKSCLYALNVTSNLAQEAADYFGCPNGKTPFSYLGITVGAKMSKIDSWQPVINIFEKRLSKWKSSSLSFGGRLTLIKSVLDSLPTYYFSLFKAPQAVIDKLEAIRQNFFWSGAKDKNKISWVAWDSLTEPISKGGLGLSKLAYYNIALLSKWWWRFKTENAPLWKQVTVAIHYSPRALAPLPLKRGLSGVWCSISKLEIYFYRKNISLHNSFAGLIGNGKSIRLWIDVWSWNTPLKDQLPNLYKLETAKNRSLDSMKHWLHSELDCPADWIRRASSARELEEFEVFKLKMDSIYFSEAADAWKWNGSSSGVFSVKEVRNLIASGQYGPNPRIYPWFKWVPLKVNIWGWRALIDRLPTKCELAKRNIRIANDLCPFCAEAQETTEHLFTACPLAMEVWSLVASWCKIPPIFAFEFRDLLNTDRYASKSKVIHLIILTTCWQLWKARNEKVFSNKEGTPRRILEEVKYLSFLWLTARSKVKHVEWNS